MEVTAAEKSEDLNSQAYWKKQLDNTFKDQDYEKFLTQGKKIVKRYLSKQDDLRAATSLNLFHTNIVTMEAMLFGQEPKVNVDRRYADANDDIARVASEGAQRMLNVDIGLRTDKYQHALKKALHDYLLVGMGQARVRYEAQFKQTQNTVYDSDGTPNIQTIDELVKEYTHFDYVYWQDFAWEIGRCWDECGWVAFRTWVAKDDFIARWPTAQHDAIFTDKKDKDDDTKTETPQAAVWEIWCKKSGHVYYYTESAKNLLQATPDPLKLWGFFPCGKPMMANLTTTKMVPKADYLFAQDLYMEIDQIEQRIEILTRAVKVVGVYDQSSTGIQRMLTEGVENELIPVDNWAMFAEKGGLKGQLDWLPIEAVTTAISQLVILRDDAINLLYQITGMSDILRGQSTESRVSATEQNLKAKFASTRIQAVQDMFAWFASDLQMLKMNIIAIHYDPQTIMKQSNLALSMDADVAQAAIQLIKTPEESVWRVIVRPESIAMVDYSSLKAERTEFLNAIATFMQSAGPMVEKAPETMPMWMEVLKFTVAGFKGAQQIEGVVDKAIKQMVEAQQKADQQPPQPTPEEQKMQLEQQKLQAQQQADQAKAQLDAQVKQQQAQQDQMRFQQEMRQDQQRHMQEMQQSQQEFQLKMQQLMMEGRAKAQQAEAEIVIKSAKAEQESEIREEREEAREEMSGTDTD